MGETGCGKTTIINLLERFYDVKEGRITLDGINVKRWNLQSLRSKFGVATQDIFLFSDTVEGNIAYGGEDISMEQVKQSAATAQVDFIKRLPNGYDTIIGERGVGLSGGQRQRIALARALAIKPRILVLDDGRQCGFGTHEALLESCGVYREICRSQGIVTEEVGV